MLAQASPGRAQLQAKFSRRLCTSRATCQVGMKRRLIVVLLGISLMAEALRLPHALGGPLCTLRRNVCPCLSVPVTRSPPLGCEGASSLRGHRPAHAWASSGPAAVLHPAHVRARLLTCHSGHSQPRNVSVLGTGASTVLGRTPTAGCLFIFQSTVSVYQTMISFGVCVAKSTPPHRRAPSQEPRGALARAGWGFGVQTKHLSGCLSPCGGGAGRRQEQQLQ